MTSLITIHFMQKASNNKIFWPILNTLKNSACRSMLQIYPAVEELMFKLYSTIYVVMLLHFKNKHKETTTYKTTNTYSCSVTREASTHNKLKGCNFHLWRLYCKIVFSFVCSLELITEKVHSMDISLPKLGSEMQHYLSYPPSQKKITKCLPWYIAWLHMVFFECWTFCESDAKWN